MSATFPASYSTLSPAALAGMLATQYALQNVVCSLIVRGVGDTYLVVADDKRFILRVYRQDCRTREQVQEELDLLLVLNEGGVPVSYPIADTTGGLIQQLNAAEGGRCAVLFTYAAGIVQNQPSEAQLKTLGREMARMHNVSASLPMGNSRWTYDMESTLHKPLRILKDAFAEDPELYIWLQQAAIQIERKLATLYAQTFDTGYSHYDLLPKNFHFDGGKVTFFDFDFLGYGWLVNDIMTFWQHLCLDVHFGKKTQEAADKDFAIFIDSYREVRAISDNELAAMPYLFPGFWLYYSAFHSTHDQFYAYIQPAHMKGRFGIIKKIMERYCDPEFLP